ncbi:hypothetical protein MPER_11380 [Moniliophthora perniciosa FA553]|nr:hypothetical protein MPER_11380 [Moniliophthora perniciosa FA553]
MSGLWFGKLYFTSENHFEALLNATDRPLEYAETNIGFFSIPVYMRLKEHVSDDPQNIVEGGEMGCGWFPEGMDYTVGDDGLEVTVPKSAGSREEQKRYWYRTYQPGSDVDVESCGICDREDDADHEIGSEEEEDDDDLPLPTRSQSHGTQDVVLTGSTDERHGKAWNHYTFHGRVRSWDGETRQKADYCFMDISSEEEKSLLATGELQAMIPTCRLMKERSLWVKKGRVPIDDEQTILGFFFL